MKNAILILVFVLGLFLKISTCVAEDEGILEEVSADNSQETGELSEEAMEPAPRKQIARREAYQDEDSNAASVLGVKHRRAEREEYSVAFIPMFGVQAFGSAPGTSVTNRYTMGLGVEIPLSRVFSFESEGSYAQSQIGYGTALQPHNFDQYVLGGSLKAYLMEGPVRPYVGAGLLGQYYSGMRNATGQFSQTMGAGQIMGGADIRVVDNVSVGGRAAYVNPLLGLAATDPNPGNPVAAYADARAVNNSYFKFLANLKVAF